MTRPDVDTDHLFDQANRGDGAARQQLLARLRGRLKAMVGARLDRRLAARRLDTYLRDRPIPFYPWLRQLAWDRPVKEHRAHLGRAGRNVRREEPGVLGLPDESAVQLAARLMDSTNCPARADPDCSKLNSHHPAAMITITA